MFGIDGSAGPDEFAVENFKVLLAECFCVNFVLFSQACSMFVIDFFQSWGRNSGKSSIVGRLLNDGHERFADHRVTLYSISVDFFSRKVECALITRA